MTTRKVFINLPVADVGQTIDFWKQLGFDFNPQFTDEKAACMVLSEEAYVMLLGREFFQTFTKKAVCDSAAATEVICALSCESRAEVDSLVERALAAGGSAANDPMDHGFMYGSSFHDPDGHLWEVLWMDPAHAAG